MPVWRVFSPSSPPRPLKPAPSVPHRPQKGLAQSFLRRGGTIHFPVVKPDGTVRVIPITVSEFAQRRWPDIPDRLRWYFTFLGAVTPSKLLPAETRALLYSALQLRLAGRPAVEWARDLEGIRAARRLVTELREVEAYATGKPAGRVSAPVPEFEVVEDHLIKLEKVVRDAEQQVKAAGYEWKDGLVRKGKGRPSRADDLLGQLVRVLVHIWIDQGGEPGNHPETRVWIASQLAPFYPAATPDTSSRPSPLYTAVGNAFRR